MKFTFTPKEFDKFRSFQDRMAKEFGDTVYAGTNYAMALIEYSPQLTAMLRPMPPETHFEYELAQLSCKDCKKNRMYLALPGESTFVCEDCATKRSKSGAPK